MDFPKLKINHKKSEIFNIILHGGSKGIDSEFICKLHDRSVEQDQSVISFNFPYIDRGEQTSSGIELYEEQKSIDSIFNLVRQFNPKKIRVIAKSLGGIVIAKYLLNSPKENTTDIFELIILGYIIREIDLTSFNGGIKVIQGSLDRYGNAESVREDLLAQGLRNFKTIEIGGADHSYRNPETKYAEFEDEVVDLVFK